MGILSGLEKLGFKSMEKVDLFEEEKKKPAEKANAKKNEHKELTERDMLYDKSVTCPVCQRNFKVKAVSVGKARLSNTDVDMRPTYVGIDPLKYDVIVCHECGYASLSKFFKDNLLTDRQIEMIKENVSANYISPKETKIDVITYDEAIENHKLALLNSVVKKSRASEKAYICLKLGWLYRGKLESYDKQKSDYEQVADECRNEEKQYLEEAGKGFISAISHESGKICGMDPLTVEYLCAAIAFETGDNEESLRIVSRVIVNPAADRRMKDKARDLKELITGDKE